MPIITSYSVHGFFIDVIFQLLKDKSEEINILPLTIGRILLLSAESRRETAPSIIGNCKSFVTQSEIAQFVAPVSTRALHETTQLLYSISTGIIIECSNLSYSIVYVVAFYKFTFHILLFRMEQNQNVRFLGAHQSQ